MASASTYARNRTRIHDVNAFMKRVSAGLISAGLLVSGCGPTNTVSSASPASSAAESSPTPTTAGSPASSGLFAVLRARGPGSSPDAHDFIVIAGPDGYGVARATFAPRHIPTPATCCGGLITEPEAHVVGGAVYFIDGSGVVRRLTASGSISVVASFAQLTSQLVSFAVSPDGRQVMASILTIPAANQLLILDLRLVSDGSPPRELKHLVADQGYDLTSTQVVGWDAQGPIAVIGAPVAAEHGLLDGQRWLGGYLAHLDLNGAVVGTIGGSDCIPYSPPTAGRVICADSTVRVEVRTLTGNVVWKGAPQMAGTPDAGDLTLSPDGSQLAMRGAVQDVRGSAITLPASFAPQGWLNRTTLVGILTDSRTFQEIGIIRLAAPDKVEDWGFAGEFVGTL